jgi:hypothetical protein
VIEIATASGTVTVHYLASVIVIENATVTEKGAIESATVTVKAKIG